MQRERIIIPLIFLVVVSAILGGLVLRGDSIWVIPTALSLVREGDIDLDEYTNEFAFTVNALRLYESDAEGMERLLAERPDLKEAVDAAVRAEGVLVVPIEVDGHYYNMFPYGAALVAAPVVGVLHVAGFDVLGRRAFVEHLVCALVVAVASIVVYLTARRRIPVGAALLVTAAFAFGTSMWSTAGVSLFQHGPVALMLALCLHLLVRAEREPALAALVGLPLAFAYVVRPTAAVAVVTLSLFVLVRHRDRFLRFLLAAAFVAVPFLVHNVVVFGDLLPPYYTRVSRLFSQGFAHFVSGVFGTLVSPGRGLFVYSPILLFAAAGIVVAMRKREPLAPFLLATLLLHWMLISATDDWWGGLSYGPRYFTDMLPILAFFLIVLFERAPLVSWRRPTQALLAGLLVFSVATHFTGAYAIRASDRVRPEYRPCPSAGRVPGQKYSYRVVVWDPINFPWNRVARAIRTRS